MKFADFPERTCFISAKSFVSVTILLKCCWVNEISWDKKGVKKWKSTILGFFVFKVFLSVLSVFFFVFFVFFCTLLQRHMGGDTALLCSFGGGGAYVIRRFEGLLKTTFAG